MSRIFNYCPEAVNILVAGFLPIEGLVDGTFVSITKDVVPFSVITMPDGTSARLHNESQTYTIGITLHSGSGSNDVLTKMWQLDELTSGMGKFPLIIKDQSGSDLFFSTETWIEGIPPLVKSVGVDERTWVLRSAYATINIGGNMDAANLLSSIINMASSALPGLL
jgi:hypothetical protein